MKTDINLCDFGLGKNFFDMAPKAQKTRKKIDKMDFIKPLCFKDIKKMKRISTKQGKILVNHKCDS